VHFGPRAAATASSDFHYEIKRVERPAAIGGRTGQVKQSGQTLGSDAGMDTEVDEPLFERLRVLRRDIAREIGKPPYIVFSDKTLRDMTRIRPVTNAQFLAVNGVGENKLNLYGKRFMEAIRSFEE
jgi:ATP-dependent DNA helicase RecQ